MGKRKLYKGRYFFALYSSDDTLVGIFDTADELARFLKKPLDSLLASISMMNILIDGELSKAGTKPNGHIRYEGRKMSLFLFSAQ